MESQWLSQLWTNIMNIERIKRLPLIKQLYQLTALGYGRCSCCGMPFKYCQGHSINVSNEGGFAPICEYCWNTSSYEEVKKGIDKWVNQVTPYYPYTRGEYKKAFIDEWFKEVHEKE